MFVFDGDYDNNEQVRSYFAQYGAIRAEFDAAGKYPYNADFMGKIEGLIGSPDEEAGVYLLQRMHDLDDLAARLASATEAGAIPATDLPVGREVRGTLIRHGWYMGGTGYSETENVRVLRDDRDRVTFKLPRQRQWRQHFGQSITGYHFIAA